MATNSSRILTHLVVLLIAAAIPVTASITAAAHAQRFAAGPLAAQAAAPEAIENYVLTQRGVFLKPAVAVTELTERKDATRYQVQSGDTIGHIAAKFGLRIDSVRWANRLTDIDTLKIGQELQIPPVNGVLLQVAAGDTLASLAAKYKADTQAIIEFNLLRDPENLVAGTTLMIPDGQGEEYVPPAPKRVVSTPVTPQFSGGGSNHFPWGYCTWWVASKRYVPWSGNAWEWWGNARAYGYAEGQTPRPGAIMVTWESSVGHVAYVESVNGDGSFSVSEMNYHFIRGEINHRTITPSQLGRIGLLGFIY